jgi:hypothetical protein
MAQEIIRLCKIGKSALNLARLALSVEVPNPFHPATHAGCAALSVCGRDHDETGERSQTHRFHCNEFLVQYGTHSLLCMLVYYVEFHMRRALAPMLFADHEPEGRERVSIVASAEPSVAAVQKRSRRKTMRWRHPAKHRDVQTSRAAGSAARKSFRAARPALAACPVAPPPFAQNFVADQGIEKALKNFGPRRWQSGSTRRWQHIGGR